MNILDESGFDVLVYFSFIREPVLCLPRQISTFQVLVHIMTYSDRGRVRSPAWAPSRLGTLQGCPWVFVPWNFKSPIQNVKHITQKVLELANTKEKVHTETSLNKIQQPLSPNKALSSQEYEACKYLPLALLFLRRDSGLLVKVHWASSVGFLTMQVLPSLASPLKLVVANTPSYMSGTFRIVLGH